ncbi:MAG TPA: hypothetical protein VKG63_19730 [Steroidobacteraceae bacterium]|nr:hypothetical protein [Steroidobacteraceae bacterium]
MFSIARETVPEDALLKTHRGGAHPERWGRYGDCFSVTVDGTARLADFVFAFYTSPVFRIERLMLRALAGAPSDDADARRLADGSAASFAVWNVGERTATQLLMCDRYERTRSWFRVVPVDGGRTRLQFGSAVAARERATGTAAMSGRFRLLLGFHVVYSQLLLHAAKAGVMRARVAA